MSAGAGGNVIFVDDLNAPYVRLNLCSFYRLMRELKPINDNAVTSHLKHFLLKRMKISTEINEKKFNV